MYLLRRSAFRAVSRVSTNFTKPRSITTIVQSPFKPSQTFVLSSIQRRFISDEPFGQENASSTASESFQRPERSNEEQQPEAPENKVLYVGNLYFGVTNDQLAKVFSEFGSVENVKIATDRQGLSRGYAHVAFQNIEDATKAKNQLSQQLLEGRRLHVLYHREQPRRFSDLREPRSPRQPSATLFIGNLPYQMSDKDLNDLFRDLKNIIDVRVAMDRRTGQPRGFAHAEFSDIESATAAKDLLSSKVIYGRPLRLDYSDESKKVITEPTTGSE